MEKKELLENVLTTKLPYRNKLNIPSNIGFGLEIESGLNYSSKMELSEKFSNQKWKSSSESSITNSDSLELSSPVFYNRITTWKKLKNISEELRKFNPDFSQSSFQVNIDNILDEKSTIKFLKLMSAYEDVIYNFSKGNDKYLREIISYYASSIGFLVYNNYYDNESYYYNDNFLRRLINNKKYTLSLKNNNIIEFRTPNSTFDCFLWQNYINTFTNIILTCKNKEIDEDKLKYYIGKFANPYYDSYDEDNLYLNKAVEFINIIFNNDIDKLYFMKQYLSNTSNKQIKKLMYDNN